MQSEYLTIDTEVLEKTQFVSVLHGADRGFHMRASVQTRRLLEWLEREISGENEGQVNAPTHPPCTAEHLCEACQANDVSKLTAPTEADRLAEGAKDLIAAVLKDHPFKSLPPTELVLRFNWEK